jgi:sigma-E factor negative regulatory protein RseB
MRVAACLTACLLAGIAQAEPEARDLLDEMNRALQTSNYEGTFIYRHGQQVETMQIVHGYHEGATRERLVSLTGEAREIIRDQDLLTCVWPASKSVLVEPRRGRSGLPSAFPTGADGTSPYYAYTVQGTQRVAGLPCQLVRITPTDQLRYGYRLCIDPETGMPLKSEILDEQGEMIEQVMFTSINVLDSIPDSRFEPVTAGADFTWHRSEYDASADELPADPGWDVVDPPRGFSVSSNVKRRLGVDGDPVQHMVLSDGLASVSVFIAAAEDDEALYQGMSGSGALNAYATVSGDYQVTVMGEVPEATVMMIGDSLSRLGSSP